MGRLEKENVPPGVGLAATLAGVLRGPHVGLPSSAPPRLLAQAPSLLRGGTVCLFNSMFVYQRQLQLHQCLVCKQLSFRV